MNDAVLLTGATGFVGSHVAELLRASGKTVRLLVRDLTRLKHFDSSDYQIAIGDITRPGTLGAALDGIRAVVHCAGLTKAKSLAEYRRVNSVATGVLARKAELAGVERFVNCSSLAAAGPSSCGTPLAEESAAKPISSYGISKLEGEREVAENCRNTKWITIRPPAVMGPRDEQFAPLFRMASRFGVYTTVGDPAREYSLIGVHDLARALCLAVDAQQGFGKIYYATLPKPFSWNDVADEIAEVRGRKLRAIRVPEAIARVIGAFGSAWMSLSGRPVLLNGEKVKEMLASGWSCRGDRIHEDWGFECEQSLRDVVRDTWNYYLKQGWL